jgi:hypothetical protein
MSRIVCFIDEIGGQYGTCLRQEPGVDCERCDYNPFPKRIVPVDRILKDIYKVGRL